MKDPLYTSFVDDLLCTKYKLKDTELFKVCGFGRARTKIMAHGTFGDDFRHSKSSHIKVKVTL
jgi:hypothetical protein